MKYEVVSTDDGAVTIIDAETRMSILGIDTRRVDGVEYSTPVFAEEETARRVLDALNKKEGGDG